MSHKYSLLLAAVLAAGWSSPPAAQPRDRRYLVTERPVDVGFDLKLCLGVDPADTHGVWWWEPGSSGCASRSTGPGVFHADSALISRSAARADGYKITFRIGTHSSERPFVDVSLLVEGRTIRRDGTGATVPLLPRTDLDIPEKPGR